MNGLYKGKTEAEWVAIENENGCQEREADLKKAMAASILGYQSPLPHPATYGLRVDRFIARKAK